MQSKQARWVTQTGVFLAVLIVAQVLTRPLGTTFVTGSVTNTILILSTMLCGISAAAVLCAVSPILATVLGIGPLWPFIPVIIAGNLVLVILWHLIALRREKRAKAFEAFALVAAAAAKFLVLYLGIVNLIVPLVLKIGEPQASAVSAAFSWPQLVTAAIGGLLAMSLRPALSRAIAKAAPRA